MKKIYVAGLVALALFLTIPRTQAAEFLSPGPDDNRTVVVSNSQNHKNLYVVAKDIIIDGPTTGDLYLLGSNITVDGTVEQDVVAMGGTAVINGAVGGDIRILGGKVTINGTVSGDVLVLGGTVTVYDRSAIGGDFVVSGGTTTLAAPVSGSARIAGGTITIDSKISGKVSVQASKGLAFGPHADISQPVSFAGPDQPTISDGAKIARIDYQYWNRGRYKKGLLGFLTALVGVKLLATLFAGLLLAYILPRRTAMVINGVRRRPWSNLGVGFLVAVIMPIVVIILSVILLGLYVASLLFLWYLYTLLLASLVASIFLGAWLIKLLTRSTELKVDWQAVLLGGVALILLMLIPVIGWLLAAVLSLMAFGALAREAWNMVRSDRHQTAEGPELHN